jgi:predicted DNA-binding transcriptional regulator YafY
MGVLKYLDRFKRIDDLVRRRATGSPEEFAKKLGISKSMLMLNLAELKELGAPLKYNSVENTYYYDCYGRLRFEFTYLRANED